MTRRPQSRADLHCHSAASGPNGNWWYAQLEIADCKTPPEEVYAQAKAAGMDFVTLTDHDTIEGALELTHHPDFIVGEEVTVTFPDDGERIDVVVLGLDERQHREIQRRREDASALVAYLRSQGLVHFLAHPIYDPANALTPAQIERLQALFTLWETRNGARLAEVNELVERLVPDITQHRLLAAEHGLDPSSWFPGGVGGSDDHGGSDIGTSYTATPRAASPEEFLDHLRAGHCLPGGVHAEPARMTHMVMRLLDRHRPAIADERAQAWQAIAAGKLSHRQLARLVEALAAEPAGGEICLPFPDPHRLAHELGTLRRYARSQLQLLPYLVVQAYLARERQGARALATRLGKAPPSRPLRVALLADGLASTNGVAETYRQLLPELDESIALTPITCGEANGFSAQSQVARVGMLRLPLYPDLDLPLPHLSELAERIFDIDADLIHVTGPGPLGIAGAVLAKALRLPLVAGYHTELADYATAMTGDPLLRELATAGMRRFYGTAQLVLAPSEFTTKRLPRLLGLDAARLTLLRQGVDACRFAPEHADRSRFNFPRSSCIVLCVSRLAHEKSHQVLLEAAAQLRNRRDIRFVIVGDGPARAELERTASENVTFTGWLRGHELAATYASADVFALASRTETFGQVLLEAQASGLPCIVSPSGAAHEAILVGSTGLLACDDTAEAFAAAIVALADDETRRRAFARVARAHAQSQSWQSAAQALTTAYRQLTRPEETRSEIEPLRLAAIG